MKQNICGGGLELNYVDSRAKFFVYLLLNHSIYSTLSASVSEKAKCIMGYLEKFRFPKKGKTTLCGFHKSKKRLPHSFRNSVRWGIS